MTNEEKTEIIKKALEKQDLFSAMSVQDVNHKPHPFMIGPRHVTDAADNYGGRLGEATLNKIPCSHKECNLMYADHTSDKVCFLQLKRSGTQKEGNSILKGLVDELENGLVDGYSFVETTEKYRIT